MPNIPLPLITNASAKQILANGVIVVYVQLGTTVHRVRFYVAPCLAVPIYLVVILLTCMSRPFYRSKRKSTSMTDP
jgi:hypothetical protein